MIEIKRRTKIRLQSTLYRQLYTEGGDRLVAVYCMLRSVRGRYNYFPVMKATNGKRIMGASLLSHLTGISKPTLEKYLKPLKKLGLVHINLAGEVFIKGTNKLNILYQNKGSRVKLVPIIIGKNISDTAYYSKYVRFHSNLRAQNRMIGKKILRNDLLEQLNKSRTNPSYRITAENYRAALYLEKKLEKRKKGKELQLENILSLNMYGYLSNVNLTNLKSGGAYYKKKLKQKGMVYSERRFSVFDKSPSYEAFLLMKKYNVDGHKLFYRGRNVFKEEASKFRVLPIQENELASVTKKYSVWETKLPTPLSNKKEEQTNKTTNKQTKNTTNQAEIPCCLL
jgi:DNA-binding transcriptional ArsR family regulator